MNFSMKSLPGCHPFSYYGPSLKVYSQFCDFLARLAVRYLSFVWLIRFLINQIPLFLYLETSNYFFLNAPLVSSSRKCGIQESYQSEMLLNCLVILRLFCLSECTPVAMPSPLFFPLALASLQFVSLSSKIPPVFGPTLPVCFLCSVNPTCW